MSRFGLVAFGAAVVACIPCVLLPVLAAAGAGGGVAVLGSWLGVSVAAPLALLAVGLVLIAIHLVRRRRACEVP